MNIQRLFLTQFTRRFSFSPVASNENTIDEKFQSISKERTLNIVQLIGRVGQDPRVAGQADKNESDVSDDSKKLNKVVLFSLATNEYLGLDDQGQAKYRTDWHRITVISHRLQDYAQKRVRQGDRIHVTGRLHYDLVKNKSGEPRLITNVVADDFMFLNKFQES